MEVTKEGERHIRAGKVKREHQGRCERVKGQRKLSFEEAERQRAMRDEREGKR